MAVVAACSSMLVAGALVLCLWQLLSGSSRRDRRDAWTRPR
jgi:hypothetical protein